MAVLNETDRARTHRGLMRWLSSQRENYPCDGFEKADLRDAIDETDDWIEANQASFVAALSDPFKTASGAALKTLVFTAVALMRTDPELARRLFGEID
jgi:hypothetical protein